MTTPKISGQPAAPGQRVRARHYVTQGLNALAGGTVKAVDGRWIEVAWDDLDIRLGMRASHLFLEANATHQPNGKDHP